MTDHTDADKFKDAIMILVRDAEIAPWEVQIALTDVIAQIVHATAAYNLALGFNSEPDDDTQVR